MSSLPKADALRFEPATFWIASERSTVKPNRPLYVIPRDVNLQCVEGFTIVVNMAPLSVSCQSKLSIAVSIARKNKNSINMWTREHGETIV